MTDFLIKPHKREFPRVYDNTFLWNESNVYVMANHRLALWCWLQCKEIFERKHVLVHIDEHTDARRWEAVGEPECLERVLSNFQTLKDFNTYESFQCPLRDAWTDRVTRPCITWDNFVHLAAKAGIFAHYSIYSSVGDWHTGLPDYAFDFYQKVSDISNLSTNLEAYAGKCILDIDLDFFDYREGFPKNTSEDAFLISVMSTIQKYNEGVSMITISLNESPGDELWDKRQHQLSIVKEILNLKVPIPVTTSEEIDVR